MARLRHAALAPAAVLLRLSLSLDRGNKSSMTAALVFLLTLTLFLNPATAVANTTVAVVNTLETPQADADININGSFTALTNGGGTATVNVNAGDVLQVTRDYNGNPSDPCNAPEQQGVQYTVPNPVPTAITITVADANGVAYKPELGSSERKFVGLVNQLRAQQGPPLAPLYISNTLVDAASRYVSQLSQNNNASNPHCLLSGPQTRIINSGFPLFSAGGGEIAYWGGYRASDAFTGFENSPPHRAIMLSHSADTIGVAVDGDAWIADIAYVNPSDAYAYRANMTADTGDPNLPEDNLAPGEREEQNEQSHSHHHPRLRHPHLRLKARGKRVEIKPDRVLIGHHVRLNLTRWQHYCWLEPGPPNGHLVRYCSERKIGKPKKSQIKLKEHTMLRLPGLGHGKLYHLLARTPPFKMGKRSYAAAHARITFR